VLALRAFPNDDWRGFRLLVFALSLVGLALAVTGVLATKVFHQPTTIKYAATVVGFGLLALLTTVRSPLKLLVGLAILVAPIRAVFTFQDAQVTPLLAVDLLALLVALPRFGSARSALRPMSIAFALLLLPAVAGATSPGSWIVWLAATIATGWLTFIVAREPGGPSFVVSMLVISGLIQSVIAIWEFKTKHQLALYSASGSTAASDETFFRYGKLIRPEGTLEDPNGLGQVLALYLPLILVFAASMRRLSRGFLVLCVGGVVALGLALSLSRIGLIGGLVGAFIALLLLPRGRRVTTGGGVAVVGVAVVTIALTVGGSGLQARVNSIFNPTASHVRTAAGDVQREEIWRAALRVGEGNAVTGVGLGNITTALPKHGVPIASAANAQNTFLQFFAEGGVIALLAFVGVIVAALTDLGRSFRRERLWSAGAAGSLVATVVTWTTDVEVRYVQISATVAILLGLIAALSDCSASPAKTPSAGP
jgi:O-antigen ligase